MILVIWDVNSSHITTLCLHFVISNKNARLTIIVIIFNIFFEVVLVDYYFCSYDQSYYLSFSQVEFFIIIVVLCNRSDLDYFRNIVQNMWRELKLSNNNIFVSPFYEITNCDFISAIFFSFWNFILRFKNSNSD